ncbi:Rab family GTPase [uncultured Winogradskyella sp.]|uniref:Rab family GTPase n=1 Tax=uncultured Winogradskyella sp. TaxID=395353 RepID=UPI002619CE41|nr:Rab family GTPase [uncultured Winogradskyella sp.]
MSNSKKIVLLGHFGVGKTSVMRKYVTDEFSSDYKVTIGVHILKKDVEDISLILWDIEGTKDINRINKSYLLGAHSFIITYDITRPSTFQNLESQITGLKKDFPNALIKVIGNKVDLLEKTAIQEDRDKQIVSITDYLTSAKTGENIETLFLSIASELSK